MTNNATAAKAFWMALPHAMTFEEIMVLYAEYILKAMKESQSD